MPSKSEVHPFEFCLQVKYNSWIRAESLFLYPHPTSFILIKQSSMMWVNFLFWVYPLLPLWRSSIRYLYSLCSYLYPVSSGFSLFSLSSLLFKKCQWPNVWRKESLKKEALSYRILSLGYHFYLTVKFYLIFSPTFNRLN